MIVPQAGCADCGAHPVDAGQLRPVHRAEYDELIPVRVQLRRTKGWKMPANTVKVDRSTRMGNPFTLGDFGVPDRAAAKRLFREWREGRVVGPHVPALHHLRGKNLACWCPLDQPCHADVLLELANKEPTL